MAKKLLSSFIVVFWMFTLGQGAVFGQVDCSVAPDQPGPITSDDTAPVCPGDQITYSISPVTNVDSYTWTVPSGWTINSGQNSVSISVTAGSAGQNGEISVTASNSCGTSNAQTLAVTVEPEIPAQPGIINSDDTAPVCPGDEITYSISSVTNADSYSWTVPSGWTITNGQNSNSLSVTAGSEGQNGNISVTASNSCGTSNAQTLAVTVEPGIPAKPGEISSNDTAPVCPGDEITYSISSVTNADSYTWTVPSGWTINSGQNSRSISVTAGSAGQNGDISVTASNSCGTSDAQSLAVTVEPGIPAQPSGINGNTILCPEEILTYSISSIQNADADGYTWSVPTGWIINSGQGSTNIEVKAGARNQNGQIKVTAENSCGVSEEQILDVIVIDPSVSITSQGPTTICSFESVAFNVSTFSDGGASSYSYEWQRYSNGSWMNVGTGTTITTGTSGTSISLNGVNDIQNGNKIRLQVLFCDGDFSINSNEFTVTVNDERIPEVEITASANEICAGEEVTFTASPINGGTSPEYIWYVEGTAQTGQTGSQFATTLSANATVSVELISNTSCVDPSKANPTDEMTISVNPLIIPDVNITASSTDINNTTSDFGICYGKEVSFTATPINGGTNPQYQWYVGGNPVESNSATYTTTALAVGSQTVYVEMISNLECVDDERNPAQSNQIGVQVNPLVEPTVKISTPDTDNTICEGSSITFNADPNNSEGLNTEGPNPQYNWKVNGSIVSTTLTPEFTTSSLNSGDMVSVELLSDIECVDPALNPAKSEGIAITVNPILEPSVSIETDKTVACFGDVVNFTSTLINGGSNPEYQWYVGTTPAGTGSTFSPNNLPIGTNVQVYLEVTNNDECVASDYNVITSSIVEIEVVGGTAPQPGIISGSTAICPVADDLVYSIESVSEATSYEWELPTGWIFKGLEDGASVTVKATNNSVRGKQFIKVRSNNICGSSSWQELEIEIQDFVEVQAGEDQTVCQDATTVDLSGSASFGNGNANKLNPTWQIVTGDGTLNNPTDLVNATYVPGGADGPANPVTLRIITDQPKGACQAGSDEMTVNFYEDASVTSISTAFSVCQASEINLSSTIGGSADTGTWTAIPSTAGSFANADQLHTVFTPDPSFSGDITFTLTASGPCSPDATDTVVVTVEEASIVNAGEDFSMCSTESIPLNGSSTGGSGVQWTTSGDGSFGDSTSATSTYSPGTSDIANGIVTLTLTTTGSPATCGEVFDEVVVTVFEQPQVDITLGGAAICEDENYDISATITGDSGPGQWTTSGDGTFSIANSSTTTYTPGSNDISNGSADLTYTIQADNSNCAEASDTFTLTLEPLPVIEEWSDQVICSNSTLTLDGANITGGATQGQWQILSGGGSLSSTTMSANYKEVIYTPPLNQSANVVLRLTTEDPAGNCPAVSYDLNVSINKEPVITSQPSNVGVCSTEPSELSVVATGDDLNYQWYKDGSPVGTNSSILSFSNTTSSQAGNYHVEVSGTDSCGLVTSEMVSINVDENIIITAPARDESVCGNGLSEATFEFIAHANGADLNFTWLKDGNELNIDADPDITFEGPTRDTEGVYTGALKIVNIGNEDIQTYNGNYQVLIEGPEGFSCSTAISNNFFLRVNQFPEEPVIEDILYCQFDTPQPLNVVTGSNLKWYASETGDDLFTNAADEPINPLPSTDTFGETTYWVSQTPDVCESNRVPVKVIVSEKPTVPETETIVDLCHNAPGEPLAASGVYTLNWYDANGDPLGNTAPTPDTQTVTSSPIIYFVSQTHTNGCESDLVEIQVNVNALPEVTATSDDEIICEGTSTTLRAGGATSYVWMENETEIGFTADFPVSPTATTTYTVIGMDGNGCTNTAEVVVNVDPPSKGGSIAGPSSICIGGSDTLTLEGDVTGEIKRWEKLEEGGTWIEINETAKTLAINNFTTPTKFRAVVKSGVCNEVYSEEISIGVDPLPEGGELNWVGVGRLFSICEVQEPGYAVDLQLTGSIGSVEKWEYRASNQTSWTTIEEGGSVFQGTTLSSSKVESLIGNRSVVFRASVTSGACAEPAYSETALLTIISSEILPDPVTVNPDVICFGDEVTLSAETGYTSGTTITEDGMFDNAGITNHDWRVTWEGDVVGFDTDANNTRPDRWKRATDHPLTTADLTSPYNHNDIMWGTGITDGNKGFAVVSSSFSSTMETPVFGIDDMDAALLTFDQAYNLTPGASIAVEISKDGGATYESVPLYYRGVSADADQGITSGNYADFGLSTPEDRPENKIELDLGPYLGENNLRIKFTYEGVRIGDVWAVDNINFADGPPGASQEWTDYTDPDNPVIIGTGTSEIWIPKKIGWNNFEFKTTMVYNSQGDACPITEHSESVMAFAFDQYTTTTTAEKGECGSNSVILAASVTGVNQGEITNYPTADGYVGQWEVTGPEGATFSASNFTNENTEIEAINDPNAVFTPDGFGSYTIKWILTPTTKNEDGVLIENAGCPPVVNEVAIEMKECFALDFDGMNDYVLIEDSYSTAKSVEAWVRPESENGPGAGKVATIYSTENFELHLNSSYKPVFLYNGKRLTSKKGLTPDGRWYHLAVTFEAGSVHMFIDGIEIKDFDPPVDETIVSTGSQMTIGASYNGSVSPPDNHFSGWIEEVRIWNTALTTEQIRFMMNQRLKDNGAQMGEQIPMDVPGGLTYSNLAGYYRLISQEPDPTGVITFDQTLMPANGETPDLAITPVPGRLYNMTTHQQNTAPLPYLSNADGPWIDIDTWLRPTVWDIPNAKGVTDDPIEWNIVKTFHNITSEAKDITVLGLKSETPDKLITMANPSSTMDETNSGQMMRVTHYLLLNGNMDLVGESQLLQDEGSILAEESAGWLERDQQGKMLSFNYNYWSSPVSAQGAANNADYSVSQILLDGTNSQNPQTIKFDGRYHAADGARTSPITISNYWIWKFLGEADVYEQWFHIGSTGPLATGEGFTMKGTDGGASINDLQNYVFRGKPHNGDFTRTVSVDQNYLVGNPYPSAIDAKEFILDNMKDVTYDEESGRNTSNIFNGALYYWDHFSGSTHYLEQYIGGYATWTLAGGVEAISNDERINANDQHGTKEPGQYIPVAQGFFVNTVLDPAITEVTGITVSGGEIEFKNRQRIYQKEAGNSESIFHSQEKKDVKGTTSTSTKQTAEDTRQKIWLKFSSPMGYHRQLLVTADPNTSSGFDLGYDAPMIEDNDEDMYWYFNNYEFVIQAVEDFNVDRELDLGMKVHEEGKITISIDQLKNIPDDLEIFLKDSLLQVNHDLRKTAYRATSDTGVYHNRFKVIFKDPTAVVIEEPEIPEEEGEFEIMYVNGSREILVKNPELLNIERIYLNNVLGQQLHVYYDVPAEKELRLPVKRFSSGVYIVKVHSEKGIRTKKVILE